MDTLNVHEARALAEQKLDKDRSRVIQSVGLRLAQIKHVINQLRKQTIVAQHPEWDARLIEMNPPNSDDWVLEYALNTHEYFLQKVVPFSARVQDSHIKQWVLELEELLADIRRIVVQNLSKHSAMKPYRVLGNLQNETERSESLRKEWEACAYEYETLQREWQRIQGEKQNAQEHSSFDTITRLEQSREKMMAEKKAILEQWTHNWKKVEPTFTRLMEKSKTFEQLENAQLRILQLYLANPISARMKDPRGAGFLMLLRLAVDAIEEKKVFDADEREQAKELLLEAIQNPSFSAFFERTYELDQAIEGNLKEYYAHPLYHHLLQIETEEKTIQRKMSDVRNLQESVRVQHEEVQKKVMVLVKEADEVCRENLGVQLRIE